jgi:[acyl-carrier-protein] S-malonyltransferase
MTLALLFPGQGGQHAAMLPWTLRAAPEHPLLEALAPILGADWRDRLGDAGWTSRNAVAQPLVVAASLAAWSLLAPGLPSPAAIAGYSVGELAAVSAAGVADAAAALRWAVRRAAAMDACAAAGPARGLLAVTGPAVAQAAGLEARFGLALAIRNGPDAGVFGGALDDLERAAPALEAEGARCVRLPVRVASHTRWMAEAAQAFREMLEAEPAARWASPRSVLVMGRTGGAEHAPAAVRDALAGQIDHPVQWEACMQTLSERGVRCVLEVGPGSALSRMWRGRHPEVPARSVDEFGSRDAVLRWAHRALEA